MAEVNTATSSHLNSYMHVYDNGTTARLYVTPWNKTTVADGYWQTVNTIQPLINRDIYLADALDKLAEKYTVYKPGDYVTIDPNVDGTYTINVNAIKLIESVPKYQFDENYFTAEPVEGTEGYIEVGFRLDPTDNYIVAGDNGLFCNVDYMMDCSSALSSFSAVTANVASSFKYEYTVSTALSVTAMASLPEAPGDYNLYLIG